MRKYIVISKWDDGSTTILHVTALTSSQAEAYVLIFARKHWNDNSRPKSHAVDITDMSSETEHIGTIH